MALVAACTAYFMVILDTTIVNVALPTLSRDLGATTSALQWVVDAYNVSFAALLLSAGAFADSRGAKLALQLGLGAFTCCSLACGLAPSSALLIAARCGQGVGAALAVPSSLASVHAAYPSRERRARAFGVWAAAGGIAAVTGPPLGGLLVSVAGWRAVFFVNVPVGLGGFLLSRLALPARPPVRRHADVVGQLCAIAALGSLTATLIEAGANGWDWRWLVAGLAIVGGCAAAFVASERRAPQPMLPLSLFRARSLSAATLIGLLANAGFYGQLFVLGIYLQEVHGYSPLLTGFALLPEMAMAIVGANICGRLVARHGPRPPLLAALGIGAVSLFGLSFLGANTSYLPMVPGLIGAGLGMSFITPGVTAAAMEAAPPRREGIASAVVNAGRQVGGVLGVALLGGLLAGHASFLAGTRLAMALAGVCFLLGLVVARRGIERLDPARRASRSLGSAPASPSSPSPAQ